MKYPFIINRKTRGRAVKVESPDYANALNKVLARHPGKRVTTTYALNLERGRFLKVQAAEAKQIEKYKPFKLILNTMDLMTAKVEAAKLSRSKAKKMYINVDEEGECIVSSVAGKHEIAAAFVAGSEVAIEAEEEKDETETTIKNVKPKKEKTMPTKNVKKAKPVKGVKVTSKEKVKKQSAVKEFSAKSITEAVKTFLAESMSACAVKINGKVYAIKATTNTFSLSKSNIAAGKDGFIMIVKNQKGFYVYPASKYKELFGNIMKSGTWEKTGSYGQSTFVSSHNEFWTDI